MAVVDVYSEPLASPVGQPELFSFGGLAQAPLVVDAVYEGGRAGTKADDPLAKLVPGCGNAGGFRPVGSKLKDPLRLVVLRLVVLFTSGAHPDWPDALDRE